MTMPPPVSVQLYSLREEAAADLPATLARLGEIGFVGVEPAGLHGLSPTEFRRHVEGAGLVIGSAHGAIPIGDEAERVLDAHQELGCDTLVVAMLPPDRFASRAALEASADDLNRACENARARGIRLGYHNHWWEFRELEDGRSAYELLFERLDTDVLAEVDIYWARVGKRDPARVIESLGPRARLLHVKDGPADEPRSAMTAVGEGVVEIKAALDAGCAAEWHIVELDRCDSDMFQAIERSYRYLTGSGLSRGRR